VLDLNEHERNAAGVLNPVSRASRDIDGISSPHIDAVAVKGDNALSGNHEPMLGAARMLLVAQTLPRRDLNRLDLEIPSLCEDGVSAPWAVGVLDHPAILPDVKRDDLSPPMAGEEATSQFAPPWSAAGRRMIGGPLTAISQGDGVN
jgi:hypothetical protein